MRPALLDTLPGYSAGAFRADLLAGITVAMVALPLSLAIAIASGAAPATGLVTAVVAGGLISLLGGSRVQIGGPTGAFIVVVHGVIATHGFDGLVLATLMAGGILIVAGVSKAGSLIRFVPEPVINGFTLGIAIIIATSQLKDLFGLSVEGTPAGLPEILPALWAARVSLTPAALGIGLATMVAIIVLRRAFPRFPGLIVAVGATSGAAVLLGLPVESIADRFGALPDRLPLPALPGITLARLAELLPSALTIAFLAGIESLLSAVVADRMTGQTHRPNAEITATGVANVASSLVGGLPATGAIARTATNIRAGGATPVAGLVHAVGVLAMMLLAAPLAGALALPALAGLLILTAWNMSEPHKWRDWAAAGRSDQVLLLLTMALTVLVDLTVAIGVGVALGLALRQRRADAPPPPWRPRRR